MAMRHLTKLLKGSIRHISISQMEIIYVEGDREHCGLFDAIELKDIPFLAIGNLFYMMYWPPIV